MWTIACLVRDPALGDRCITRTRGKGVTPSPVEGEGTALQTRESRKGLHWEKKTLANFKPVQASDKGGNEPDDVKPRGSATYNADGAGRVLFC